MKLLNLIFVTTLVVANFSYSFLEAKEENSFEPLILTELCEVEVFKVKIFFIDVYSKKEEVDCKSMKLPGQDHEHLARTLA